MNTDNERAAFERWRAASELYRGELSVDELAYLAWMAGALHAHDTMRADMIALQDALQEIWKVVKAEGQ